MKRLLQTLALAATLGAAGAAAAAEITLFEHDDFGGRRIGATTSISNLGNSGYNDRASSVVVHSGQWQICSDAYFRGRCVSLGPGRYPTLRAMGLNDRVSSVREVWDGPGGGGVVVGGGGDAGNADVVLYDGYNFSGASFRVGGFIVNLDGSGFNDRAQSAIVYNGNWEMCADADFGGGCQVFAPGRHATLGSLAGRVSSLRPVGGAGGSVSPGGGWGAGNRAILYEGPGLTGRAFVVDRYVSNLAGSGFNDRAASLRVERGYWMFCSDAGFQGECRTFGPGDYPDLPYGLNNRISSGRRISDEYPYQTNPNWDRQR